VGLASVPERKASSISGLTLESIRAAGEVTLGSRYDSGYTRSIPASHGREDRSMASTTTKVAVSIPRPLYQAVEQALAFALGLELRLR
jgi:hypothetical protein